MSDQWFYAVEGTLKLRPPPNYSCMAIGLMREDHVQQGNSVALMFCIECFTTTFLYLYKLGR